LRTQDDALWTSNGGWHFKPCLALGSDCKFADLIFYRFGSGFGCGRPVLMSFQNQDHERDCKLPPGCKDLADALKHEQESALQSVPDLPITKQVYLPEQVSVKYLAEVSGAGIFAISRQTSVSVNRSVAFDVAARILLKYGIEAKREPL
jgi:hypothetical protein